MLVKVEGTWIYLNHCAYEESQVRVTLLVVPSCCAMLGASLTSVFHSKIKTKIQTMLWERTSTVPSFSWG